MPLPRAGQGSHSSSVCLSQLLLSVKSRLIPWACQLGQFFGPRMVGLHRECLCRCACLDTSVGVFFCKHVSARVSRQAAVCMLSMQMEAWAMLRANVTDGLQASKWQCVWEYEDAAESIPLGVPLPACRSLVRQWRSYTQLLQLQEDSRASQSMTPAFPLSLWLASLNAGKCSSHNFLA